MPTYVYETVPAEAGAPVRRFEVVQKMSDAPLSTHPETGEPVRRVITGGMGLVGAAAAETPCGMPAGMGCGGGACGIE